MAAKDPFDDMRRFQKKMQDRMNMMFNRFDISDYDFPALRKSTIRRAVSDMRDTGKEIVVHMELPGVDKKDIKIDIVGNQLEVSVQKRQQASVKKKDYIHAERSYRGFYRSLTLPSDVNANKISASYNNGLLEIKIPKAKAKKGKRVKVK